LDLAPHHLNMRGVAHGGVITALLDSALGAAVVSSIPSEWWCATTSMSTQFIAGATSGRLLATGRVVRRGQSVAFATGEIRDPSGSVVATAHGTWHLWARRPDTAVPHAAGHVTSRDSGTSLRVGKILAVGRNYADHVAEMGAPQGRPPVVFLKPPSALIGEGATVRLPRESGEVHHEVELVAVMGRRGRAIPPSAALDYVLGIAVGLDLTLRDLQSEAKARGEPWTIAKGFDGAAPVSPWVPREVVGDGSGLEITLDVNGERRQSGNTSQMLLGLADLVALVSRFMTLERGDLLFTGTPAGVGPVRPGDRLEARLERVGSLHVAIEAEAD
jgi:uncharacterized protein (TIGR00369 family)